MRVTTVDPVGEALTLEVAPPPVPGGAVLVRCDGVLVRRGSTSRSGCWLVDVIGTVEQAGDGVRGLLGRRVVARTPAGAAIVLPELVLVPAAEHTVSEPPPGLGDVAALLVLGSSVSCWRQVLDGDVAHPGEALEALVGGRCDAVVLTRGLAGAARRSLRRRTPARPGSHGSRRPARAVPAQRRRSA